MKLLVARREGMEEELKQFSTRPAAQLSKKGGTHVF